MSIKISKSQPTAAFSLGEMMVASAIAGILMVIIANLTFFTARSFSAIANYADLDDSSRNALDRMTRDIRQVVQLTNYSPTALTFVDSDGVLLRYIYSPTAKTLRREKAGTSEILLKECDSLYFGAYQRNPISGTYDQYPLATNNVANTCKLIQLNWVCSRRILGQRLNTESVQTAKIVIRKQ
jgi:Tfp pilus assembly protein PilW